MVRIDPSANAQASIIVKSFTLLLETRPHGVRIAGPKHEIAASLAFRLIETAVRGITRFPDTMERCDVAIVMDHVPHTTPHSRELARRLLIALVREEIRQRRMVAIEVERPQRVLKQLMTEYWIMTPDQWKNLQRVPIAQLGVASYRRALTSR